MCESVPATEAKVFDCVNNTIVQRCTVHREVCKGNSSFTNLKRKLRSFGLCTSKSDVHSEGSLRCERKLRSQGDIWRTSPTRPGRVIKMKASAD
ncbi:MAG: hypothetical protein [Cressdnaviricota sp.]|nr:MAG: hypothetical protein [Cressdnaviricota sp.]